SSNLWYKAKRFYGSRLALGTVLALVLLLPSVLLPPPLAHASVSTTQNQHPNLGVPGVSTPYLCGPDVGYSCTPGYTGTNATGWAWTYYGCPNYASGCPNTPHNCTLYAAFRLMQNGVTLNWYDNANRWAIQANSHGTNVNQTPAVGSIAQWNSGIGHVAYVESYDSGGITITMDDYYTSQPWPNGYTARVHIATDSPAWPDNFIHFKDQSNSPVSAYAGKIVQWDGDTKTQKTSWLVSPDLKRYWIPDSSTYNCLRSQGYPDAGAISSTLLDQLPDQSGKWATCGAQSLGINQFLFRGSYLRSSNGLYSLQLQRSDGNLVLYGPSGALWANSRSSDYLVLQGDNNLVTYGYGVGATWATGTVGTGANNLVVQDDGNLVLYASGGVPIWDRYHGRLR
ncbi:MAG: CHAP domain-containing protein, partial [Ktedonobacteraceae bacterium]